MKIVKKRPLSATTECINQPIVVEEVTTVANEEAAENCSPCPCKYEPAIELIMAAIESLAEVAKDDPIAKDSIANLGVVMLDLKGAC